MVVMNKKIEQIKKEVAEKWGYRVVDLEGSSRSKVLVFARHEAMYRAREETPFSLPEIAYHFGRRDHTTILYGIRAWEKKKKLLKEKYKFNGDSSNT